MRVISGSAKGHKLFAPPGSHVRPALDKVKEAIFDILFDVTGTCVLDLFAGTGSIGIEALSRGAAAAVFVEEWEPALAAIRKNLDKCRLSDRAVVIKAKVSAAIKLLGRKNRFTIHGSRFTAFDLIFIDPPYLKNLVNPTLALVAKSPFLAAHTLIIVEHHPKEPIEDIEGLSLTDSRKYGQTRVTFFKKPSLVARP